MPIWWRTPSRLAEVLEKLRPLHPAERMELWLAQAASGDFTGLAEGLMQHHYDPRYDKHRARMDAAFTELATPGLDREDLAALADRIAAHALLHQG